MPELHFTKGHGTGNDFVLFADPDGDIDLTPEQIASICDRHFGVGADGVIRAVRSRSLPDGAAALAEDEAAEWFMDYHNSDGSLSEMCGNGIRVYARFLIENGLVTLERGDTLAIGTRGGVRDVQVNATGYQVDLGRWSLDGHEFYGYLPGGASGGRRILPAVAQLLSFCIDYDMDLSRLPNEKGDRVKIVLSGKYLQYKTY